MQFSLQVACPETFGYTLVTYSVKQDFIIILLLLLLQSIGHSRPVPVQNFNF
jgi:hypothetical protein